MTQILDIRHCCPPYSLLFFTCKSRGSSGNYVTLKKKTTVKSSLQATSSEMGVDHMTDRCSFSHKVEKDERKALNALPHVRLLSEFQKDELSGKVVMVRFDSNILLEENRDPQAKTFIGALSTIKYLHEAGSKVILASSWSSKTNSKLHSIDSISAYMSSILKLKVVPMKSFPMEESLKSSIFLLENLYEFKEDLANSSRFSEELCSGVDIFVNDSFFESHKVLASTVGVTSFSYSSIAGFQFEEGLLQLKNAFGTKRNPYIAMVPFKNILNIIG